MIVKQYQRLNVINATTHHSVIDIDFEDIIRNPVGAGLCFNYPPPLPSGSIYATVEAWKKTSPPPPILLIMEIAGNA